jgi:hypothetical protein
VSSFSLGMTPASDCSLAFTRTMTLIAMPPRRSGFPLSLRTSNEQR